MKLRNIYKKMSFEICFSVFRDKFYGFCVTEVEWFECIYMEICLKLLFLWEWH